MFDLKRIDDESIWIFDDRYLNNISSAAHPNPMHCNAPQFQCNRINNEIENLQSFSMKWRKNTLVLFVWKVIVFADVKVEMCLIKSKYSGFGPFSFNSCIVFWHFVAIQANWINYLLFISLLNSSVLFLSRGLLSASSAHSFGAPFRDIWQRS